MKLEIFVCLLGIAAYAYAEVCTIDSDCTLTTCSSGSYTICFHKDTSAGIVTNGGICTCVRANLTCTYRYECQTDAAIGALNCPSAENMHCYDNICVCSPF